MVAKRRIKIHDALEDLHAPTHSTTQPRTSLRSERTATIRSWQTLRHTLEKSRSAAQGAAATAKAAAAARAAMHATAMHAAAMYATAALYAAAAAKYAAATAAAAAQGAVPTA